MTISAAINPVISQSITPVIGSFRNLIDGFSPLSLFTPGTLGVWYDFTDISTLFQDDARTTPVTASGQTVGGVLDKSGNGNHLSQVTAANRPLYTESGGLSYLVFDGTTDSFSLTEIPEFSPFTSVWGTNPQLTGAAAYALCNSGSNTSPLCTAQTGSGTLQAGPIAAGGLGMRQSSGANLAGQRVLTGVWDGAWNAAGSTIRKNGALLGTVISVAFTNDATGWNSYGLRGSSRTNTFDTGFILVDRVLTADEIDKTERWMAAKVGISW